MTNKLNFTHAFSLPPLHVASRFFTSLHVSSRLLPIEYSEPVRNLRQFIVALFRIAIAVLALGGTYRSWMMIKPVRWLYFTTDTNVLVGIVFLWAGLAALLSGVQPWPWLKGLTTLAAVMTGIVANTILPAPDIAHNPYTFGLIPEAYVVHIIVPILVVLDFLLNDTHRVYRWHYFLTWLIPPFVWLGAILIHAHLFPHQGVSGNPDDHNPYPYHFINIPAVGMRQFWINVGLCVAGLALLGLIIIGIDRLLPHGAIMDFGAETSRRSRKD
jgi:hypothetical protein